jgi:Salt stress response/antifungal
MQGSNQFHPTTKKIMLLAFFILLFPILIQTKFKYCCASSESTPIYNCSQTDLYAPGSTFQSNLFKLRSLLSTEALINGAFSNESFGDGTDKIYGLTMCFASADLDTCIKCLNVVASRIIVPCQGSKIATAIYDQCMFSYSHKDFLSVADPYDIPHCIYNSNPLVEQKTKESLMQLIADLSVTAPYTPEMLSYGVVNGTTVAALMQCTKDLPPQECSKCISNALTYFPNCSMNGTSVGIRMITRNCFIQYELSGLIATSFTKSLIAPSPPHQQHQQ